MRKRLAKKMSSKMSSKMPSFGRSKKKEAASTSAGAASSAALPPSPPAAALGLANPGLAGAKLDFTAATSHGKVARAALGADTSNCWCEGDPLSVAVRGATYLRDKKKVASAWSFYAATMASMVDSPAGILHNVASRVRLPPCDAATAALCAKHGIPRALVINLIVPMKIGVLGAVKSGAPHRHAVIVCTPSTELLRHLESGAPLGGGFRMFQRWCRECTTDEKVKGRFKLIMKLLNVEELKRLKKIPVSSAMVKSFNGKPLLVEKSGTVHIKKDEYLEYDVNFGKMTRALRKAIATEMGKAPFFQVSVSAVIQGDAAEELPEQLLFSIQTNRIDLFRSEEHVTPFVRGGAGGGDSASAAAPATGEGFVGGGRGAAAAAAPSAAATGAAQ